MNNNTAEDSLRSLRQAPTMSKDSDFAVIDELEAAQHLLKASVMACESIEAMDERNALVALIGEIERRLKTCIGYLQVVNHGQY